MSHLSDLLEKLTRQHPLERDDLCRALEESFVAAIRQRDPRAKVAAHIDRAEGTVQVTLDGHPLKPDDALIGHDLAVFAQTLDAKLRDLADSTTRRRYGGKVGALAAGTVSGAYLGAIGVQLDGGAMGILRLADLPPGESPRPGERLTAVITGLACTEHERAAVRLSRTRPELVARYLEEAVPEIADGKVVIERVSREPGYLSKVLLRSTQRDLDPLACAAGQSGEKLAALSQKLGGERVDLVEHSADVHEVCAAALTPAEVEEVLALPLAASLVAIVPEGQEQVARGRRDKNLWLASQLCGMDILVRTRQDHEMTLGAAVAELIGTLGLEKELAQELAAAGIERPSDLELTDADEIHHATGLSVKQAAGVIGRATGYVSSPTGGQ